MKILITGGAGFIGSNLIQQLMGETGHEVVNLDKLTYAGNLHSLLTVQDNPRYSFEKVDLCDADALREVFDRTRPDAVMHLAAESHVDRSIGGPDQFIQSNIVGTYTLLQAALAYWRDLPEAGDDGEMIADRGSKLQDIKTSRLPDSPTKSRFRFHHVSTDEVYGSLVPDAPAFTEQSAYDPHSPYSASKAASDHLVRSWATTYGLPVVVSNCSNNYGPFQYPEKLIPLVILNCLGLKPIPIYGNGENIRDWLHVSDHCRALRLVLEKGNQGRTYNIGGDCELRNVDLIRKLCSILDDLVPLNSQPSIKSYSDLMAYVEDRPGHDARYAIDASRIRDELGWTPGVDIDSGLRETVLWYLANQEWWQPLLDDDFQSK